MVSEILWSGYAHPWEGDVLSLHASPCGMADIDVECEVGWRFLPGCFVCLGYDELVGVPGFWVEMQVVATALSCDIAQLTLAQ